ncbi:uncharacterized protein CDV56_104727 [Aspergillus thermomutatus]|uniref:Uncharacterized protein n=1 Tax=Aspergillus thermomutatus TaxID=41047 RepID=A0A397H333_ASPTH|nr:uncharacterized protein CDV56_104727 [Aspergillus thermomutatus]RHZ56268.1 hypothetical protein CDV56_104727 [Aspergillus thermomutatus]
MPPKRASTTPQPTEPAKRVIPYNLRKTQIPRTGGYQGKGKMNGSYAPHAAISQAAAIREAPTEPSIRDTKSATIYYAEPAGYPEEGSLRTVARDA